MARRTRPGISPYKPAQAAALARIEAKRMDLVVPVSQLAERAGMELRTLMRIRASGRAWLREIRALTMALRSIEKDQRGADALFPGEDAADRTEEKDHAG